MGITRRNLLISASSVASGLAVRKAGVAAQAPASPANQPMNTRKMKLVVCGGHPGDPEYGCGGTVATLSALGCEVVLLYLNDGAWPPTPASVRQAEAATACEVLRARPAYVGQVNGHAVVDQARYDDFQSILARENPDAVLTHWPLDNHADHRAATMLAFNAWQNLGKRFALYYYEVSNGEDTLQFVPNLYSDISATERQKRAACYAHASQNPDKYYALQDEVTRFRGLERGYKWAEAFLMQQQSPRDVLSFLLQDQKIE
jgi:LmbE family N-acetylglucosaminyl deacetylase